MAQVSHTAKSNTSPTGRVRVFSTPIPDDYRGPEWPDEELRRWIAYLKDERATSIEAGNDRTPGTVSYCNAKTDAMIAELERREHLAKRFQHDPRGPKWSNAGADRRADLIELARDLKQAWPIDKFLVELMRVEVIPAGRNRWKLRCITGAHRDDNPSMTAYGDDNHVHCFACQFSGDIFDIAKLHFGITSFTEVVGRVAAATGTGVGR